MNDDDKRTLTEMADELEAEAERIEAESKANPPMHSEGNGPADQWNRRAALAEMATSENAYGN